VELSEGLAVYSHAFLSVVPSVVLVGIGNFLQMIYRVIGMRNYIHKQHALIVVILETMLHNQSLERDCANRAAPHPSRYVGKVK